MKRFYQAVGVAPAESGYGVTLDGKPLRTPAKRPLVLPTRALAEAVAEEWRAQVTEIRPQSMPLTQLCCTSVDIIQPAAEAVVAELAAYGGTDLLCYRASTPTGLVARQAKAWQPLLDWAVATHGAPLTVTDSVLAIEQPAESLATLAVVVARHRGLELTALAQLVRGTGSLVLGLAAAGGRLTAAEAFDLAELDATYQMELWGEDYEAADRRTRLMADLVAAERLLALARGEQR